MSADKKRLTRAEAIPCTHCKGKWVIEESWNMTRSDGQVQTFIRVTCQKCGHARPEFDSPRTYGGTPERLTDLLGRRYFIEMEGGAVMTIVPGDTFKGVRKK